MKRFTSLQATAAPLMRANIDTDIVIPMHRLVGATKRSELGRHVFESWRFRPDGAEQRFDGEAVPELHPEFLTERIQEGPRIGVRPAVRLARHRHRLLGQAGVPGEHSGRHRKQGLKPASAAAAALAK